MTNLRNTVGSINLEPYQHYQQSRRCICASFIRNVFVVIKSTHTIATRSKNCHCMTTGFSNRYIPTPLSSSIRGHLFSSETDKRPRREGIDRNARSSHSRSFARVQFKRGGSGAREVSPAQPVAETFIQVVCLVSTHVVTPHVHIMFSNQNDL